MRIPLDGFWFYNEGRKQAGREIDEGMDEIRIAQDSTMLAKTE